MRKKKRVPLIRQFILAFIWIILLSSVTSGLAIVLFYNIAFAVTGNPAYKFYDQARTERIVAYVQSQGFQPFNSTQHAKLKKLMGDAAVAYYLLDPQGKVLFGSEFQPKKPPQKAFAKWMSHGEDNYHHTTRIHLNIPDPKTRQTLGSLAIIFNKNSEQTMYAAVEYVAPFICVILYTLLFAGILSRRIKTPLRDLMGATIKIRDRDLDFTIPCDQNNEIGDLASALEEMRAELKHSLIREWRVEQDRREMVAALTHDLRTPLAIIQGHLEGLQDGLKRDPEKLEQYLRVIEQNAARVKILVDEMNELTEVESVDFALNPYSLDLRATMENLVHTLRVLAGSKTIRIDFKLEDLRENAGEVRLDPHRLAQVVENLVGNSIRFTPEGGQIGLDIWIEDKRVRFRVADNGPGFAENDLPRLFTKFYKGDPSRSVEKGHSGLGMSIAKLIVEKHGGTIRAGNRPEGGAWVEFDVKTC